MIYITSEQMKKVDELAPTKCALSSIQMMENAGRNIARFVSNLKPNKVIILCGKGNNGGDGLAAARHLMIYGINVEIILASQYLNEISSSQLKTLELMNIKKADKIEAKEVDIIIDALLGYNIKGNPKGKYVDLIKEANSLKNKGVKIVSVDIPSGIDPDNKTSYTPFIDADYTITLGLPKICLKHLKNVYLANIGIPNTLYKELGLKIENYFSEDDIIKIS
jgi:NAD(P)H-hydrate epimerase